MKSFIADVISEEPLLTEASCRRRGSACIYALGGTLSNSGAWTGAMERYDPLGDAWVAVEPTLGTARLLRRVVCAEWRTEPRVTNTKCSSRTPDRSYFPLRPASSPFTPALRPASRAPLHPRLRPRACSPTELLPLPGHGLRALPVLRERLGNHHGHAGGRHDRGDGVSELRGAGRHDLPHVQWVGAAAEVSRPPRVRRQRLRGLPLSAEEAPGSPTHRRGGGGGQPTLASLSLSLSRPTTPRHGMPRR